MRPEIPPFAFVGCRPQKLALLPRTYVELYRRAAEYTARRGRVITTGAAPGADQLAAEAALAVGGRVELYPPWESFEREWVRRMQQEHGERVSVILVDTQAHSAWSQTVWECHPARGRLRGASWDLLSRTVGVVQWSAAVIALPYRESAPHPAGGYSIGGTGFAIRCAEYLNVSWLRKDSPIQIFDLHEPRARDWWEVKLGAAQR